MSRPADAGEADDGGEDGFALAEVLVAFAILALVTLGLMRAFAGSTQSIAAVARTEARLDLASRILETRRADDPLLAGRLSGEEDGMFWWSEVAPVDGAGDVATRSAPALFRLTVGAGPKADGPPAALLRTLVLARGPDA